MQERIMLIDDIVYVGTDFYAEKACFYASLHAVNVLNIEYDILEVPFVCIPVDKAEENLKLFHLEFAYAYRILQLNLRH